MVLGSPVFKRADEVRPSWEKLRFLWKTDLENHFPISPNLEILFNALEEVYTIESLVRRGQALSDDPIKEERNGIISRILRLLRAA